MLEFLKIVEPFNHKKKIYANWLRRYLIKNYKTKNKFAAGVNDPVESMCVNAYTWRRSNPLNGQLYILSLFFGS